MLSKTADYALRTVACLAHSRDGVARADSLAQQTQVPRRYLNKVLKDLVESTLVHSRPGPGGGYSLAVVPDEITILDVVNAVAPLERIRHCPLGLPSHTKLCPLHRELDKAYAAAEAAFSNVSIGELLTSESAVVPLCDISSQSTEVQLSLS